MHRSVVVLSLGLTTAVAFAASHTRSEPLPRAAEVTRLQRHFDSVDVELRSRNVSNLNSGQLARRSQLIGWLREYRDAATFPTNDRFAHPTPFFRDKNGVLCAMAYLIDRSGRSDIVDNVAATRNNAYIRDLVDDPALVAWLDTWGLTVAEAARIQPAYGGDGVFFPPDDDHIDDADAMAAIGLNSLSLASAAINVVKPSYFSGFLGVVAGTASIIAGANWLDENRGTERVGTVTIAVGAASLGAGIYGLLEARNNDHDRDRYRDRRRRFSMRVTPDLALQRTEPRLGLLVHGRF